MDLKIDRKKSTLVIGVPNSRSLLLNMAAMSWHSLRLLLRRLQSFATS
jgi:hypothetical protein